MLKKIAVMLFVLLLIQMALYARLYANDLIEQASNIREVFTGNIQPESEETDVSVYLNQLGIQTRVDEQLLEEKYISPKLIKDPVNGGTTIEFNNPGSADYSLEIYDVSKGLIASFVNISATQIKLEKSLFDSGAYIYKLSGNSNIYCGTFVM